MKISIVTVCYNAAATIGDTIRSVAAQSYADTEHLIIDGASTDGTLSIIEANRGSGDLRVVSERDRGIYDAMNKGVRLATGDVVGFLNSDDFYASPSALAEVARVMQSPDIEACFADLCYVRRNDVSKVVRYWRSGSFRAGSFAHGWCPPHPTFYVRRNLFERFGGFDLRYKLGADVDLMMRFLEVHRVNVHYIEEVLVMMRMGGVGNRSVRNVRLQNKEVLRALKTNGIPVYPPLFYGLKLVSRAKQFLARSNSGSRASGVEPMRRARDLSVETES